MVICSEIRDHPSHESQRLFQGLPPLWGASQKRTCYIVSHPPNLLLKWSQKLSFISSEKFTIKKNTDNQLSVFGAFGYSTAMKVNVGIFGPAFICTLFFSYHRRLPSTRVRRDFLDSRTFERSSTLRNTATCYPGTFVWAKRGNSEFNSIRVEMRVMPVSASELHWPRLIRNHAD